MIIISVEGGLIQAVTTDQPELEDTFVIVVDYDIEGADEAEITAITSHDEEGTFSEQAFARYEPIQKTHIDVPDLEKRLEFPRAADPLL